MRLTEVVLRPVLPQRMNVPKTLISTTDYLVFDRKADERHQFIDGEIFAMAGESLTHSAINANLIAVLGGQLRGAARLAVYFHPT